MWFKVKHLPCTCEALGWIPSITYQYLTRKEGQKEGRKVKGSKEGKREGRKKEEREGERKDSKLGIGCMIEYLRYMVFS